MHKMAVFNKKKYLLVYTLSTSLSILLCVKILQTANGMINYLFRIFNYN